ncbi:hypothetical protein LZ30DRAFT_743830, partial [Colletotrichum cereale]
RYGPQRAQTCRQLSQNAQTSSTPIHDEIAVDTHSTEIGATAEEKADEKADAPLANSVNRRAQLNRRMADDLGPRNASRCVVKHEVPDGAVGDGVGGVGTPAGMFDTDTQRVFDMVEAGNESQSGWSGDVSEWETLDAQNARSPTTRATRACLSRRQAAKVQHFLRQVSLHMQLATRQEPRPSYRIVHQDRWRGLSQRHRPR